MGAIMALLGRYLGYLLAETAVDALHEQVEQTALRQFVKALLRRYEGAIKDYL